MSNSEGEEQPRGPALPSACSSSLLIPGASPHSYGKGSPWTAIPECWNTTELSCDLTRYTSDPGQRYHARVRAVAGDIKSPWKKTGSFYPEQGALGSVSSLCWSWGGSGCQGMNGSWDISLPTFPRAGGLRRAMGQPEAGWDGPGSGRCCRG